MGGFGGGGGRHPADFDDRYGPGPGGHPGGRHHGPGGPDRYSSYDYDYERDPRRGGYGPGPDDGDYSRPNWREREAAGYGGGPGGFRGGDSGRPVGYEPRGGFDRERYAAHRPGYGEGGYGGPVDRDLLPPPPPPRPGGGAAGPAPPEPAAAAAPLAAGAGAAGRGDDSDSDVDPEREAFEAELARVAADMERVSGSASWVEHTCRLRSNGLRVGSRVCAPGI